MGLMFVVIVVFGCCLLRLGGGHNISVFPIITVGGSTTPTYGTPVKVREIKGVSDVTYTVYSRVGQTRWKFYLDFRTSR